MRIKDPTQVQKDCISDGYYSLNNLSGKIFASHIKKAYFSTLTRNGRDHSRLDRFISEVTKLLKDETLFKIHRGNTNTQFETILAAYQYLTQAYNFKLSNSEIDYKRRITHLIWSTLLKLKAGEKSINKDALLALVEKVRPEESDKVKQTLEKNPSLIVRLALWISKEEANSKAASQTFVQPDLFDGSEA